MSRTVPSDGSTPTSEQNVFAPTLWLQLLVRRGRRDERGAALIEYVFLVALIAVVCLVAVAFFGSSTSSSFSSAGSHVAAAGH